MITAERGIHTVELYLRNMGYSAIQKIVDGLYKQEKIYLRKKDKIKDHCDYEVMGLFPDGIYMKLEQRYLHSPGGIRFIVNPHSLASGGYVPEALYHPSMDPDVMETVVSVIEGEFYDEEHHSIWELNKEDLSLSRVDLTWNLYFPEETDLTELIRLFKHGHHGKTATVKQFQDPVKDKHSFRLQFSDVTLTVYDKNFQITRKGQTIENETAGTNILRIELSMKRNAYYRALKLKPGEKPSYDVILHKLYKHGSKLIRKQMEDLFPCDGKHLPYQKAKRRIEKKVTNKKTQEKMLYLLEKTSRSDTLDHAIEKTQDRYSIGRKGMRSLLKQFDAIDVNPITFRKDSKIKKVESFGTLLL